MTLAHVIKMARALYVNLSLAIYRTYMLVMLCLSEMYIATICTPFLCKFLLLILIHVASTAQMWYTFTYIRIHNCHPMVCLYHSKMILHLLPFSYCAYSLQVDWAICHNLHKFNYLSTLWSKVVTLKWSAEMFESTQTTGQ